MPAWLLGAAILGWGWLCELLPVAVIMALLLESRHWVARRWVFSRDEFYLLADVTAVAFLGLSIYYFAAVRRGHFLFYLAELSPLMCFPLLLALHYSTTGRLTLDVFVHSLRKRPGMEPGPIEFSHLYLGLVLVAAATAYEERAWFLVPAFMLLAWLLAANRPRRARGGVWLMALLFALSTAWLTQTALRSSHLELKRQTMLWFSRWLQHRTDPYRTLTAIGQVGQLKLSDAILFRVRAAEGDPVPALLQEAVYSTPAGAEWLVLEPGWKGVPRDGRNGWRWSAAGPGEGELVLHYEFPEDRSLLPLPRGARALANFEAVSVSRGSQGAVQAVGITPQPGYSVRYGADDQLNPPPGSDDLWLPESDRALMRSLDLAPGRPPLQTVRDFFRPFRYSLYQGEGNPTADPLANFLQHTRRGHCEYFASATVKMLRFLGVPARYVVGYSVQERSPLSGLYLVRSRHAHAWALAHLDGRWQVVDTTPAIWADAEAEQASLIRPLQDLLSELLFSGRHGWATATERERTIVLGTLGGMLLLVLIWRMMGSPQVLVARLAAALPAQVTQSRERSPFYRVEAELHRAGRWRQRGESMRDWLVRIGQPELLPALELHYRLRFHPAGLSPGQQAELAALVDSWLAAWGDRRR